MGARQRSSHGNKKAAFARRAISNKKRSWAARAGFMVFVGGVKPYEPFFLLKSGLFHPMTHLT
jgi:hypothetical protein